MAQKAHIRTSAYQYSCGVLVGIPMSEHCLPCTGMCCPWCHDPIGGSLETRLERSELARQFALPRRGTSSPAVSSYRGALRCLGPCPEPWPAWCSPFAAVHMQKHPVLDSVCMYMRRLAFVDTLAFCLNPGTSWSGFTARHLQKEQRPGLSGPVQSCPDLQPETL